MSMDRDGNGTVRAGHPVVFTVLLLAVAAAPALSAEARPPFATEAERRFFHDLKRLQVLTLLEPARAEHRERAELARRLASLRRRRGTAAARPVTDREWRFGLGPAPGAAGPPVPSRAASEPADVRVNDRAPEKNQGITQAEVSVAAHGLDVLAAWNDGLTLIPPGPMGYGTSRDGGRTWVDGGSLPLGGGVAIWNSDPTVVVDERTGTFYVGGLAIVLPPPARNALAVVSGSFTDSGFVWGTPTVVRAVRDTIPDKLWLAIDPASGHLYLAYTTFVVTQTTITDWIDVQRSVDGNLSWEAPRKLSRAGDDGLVHGARPAVGPDGEVHVVWSAVDTTEASRGRDYIRITTSRDGGATYDPDRTVAEVYNNFGSGAPGFNRGYGLTFPGLAVDRSDGPYRGRVYVAWQESLNPFDDPPEGPNDQIEREPNESPLNAMVIDLASTVHGTIMSSDRDLFLVNGRPGETLVVWVDSLSTGLDLAVQLICQDGFRRLAFNAPPRGGRSRLLYFTLPDVGPYYIALVSGTTSGSYRFHTGLVGAGPERARDHRDVFVSSSDDGRLWSPPALVNEDPPRFDDWLPEVAVSSRGIAYVSWYDWRDGAPNTCGSTSNLRLARSENGGGAWIPMGVLSSVGTGWSGIGGNLVPNQGDYTALLAGEARLIAAWSDGRDGDPDIYAATVDLTAEPPPRPRTERVRFESAHPNPAAAEIDADVVLDGSGPARLELFDLTGRRLKVEHLTASNPGRHRIRLDLTGVRPGLCLLRLTQGEAHAVRRIAIVR